MVLSEPDSPRRLTGASNQMLHEVLVPRLSLVHEMRRTQR